MLSKLKKYLLILLLIAFSAAIVFLNFKPGTWLTGWDNLHPEFNLVLNINRSLFAVWQEYQGLGLLGGMGHASDIFRQLILSFLSFFIKANLLRFIYAALMLITGPIGMCFLISEVIPESVDIQTRKIASFLGGLFYLLNLVTVQVFFVPFEAFVTQYGFLPWLFGLFISYIKSDKRKTFYLFILFSVFSLTQGYVPTLFVVYILGLLIIFAGFYIKDRSAIYLKRFFLTIGTILIINAFWLLPFLFFTFTSVKVVGQAHENFMATQDIYLRNKEFGTIPDVALLKGFWFKYVDVNANNEFYYMAENWRQYLNHPTIQIIGYYLFSIVLLGLIYQIKHKHNFSISILLLFLVPFTLLANDTFPFSIIDTFLNQNIPLFSQVFRVPFTKFGIPAILSFSLLFSFGIVEILEFVNRRWKTNPKFVLSFFIVLLVLFVFPIFQGKLFYTYAQIQIPKEYFDLMSYLGNKNPNNRIANLPQSTYWGWNHFTWGNRGSGFLWYGISQPILDRAFDGYSSSDENYYWELSNAIYSNNNQLFERVLNKYQIKWLLYDDSIMSPNSTRALNKTQLLEMLSNSANIGRVWNKGTLSLYEHKIEDEPNNFIYIASDLPNIARNYSWNNLDKAYADYGNYISVQTTSPKSMIQNLDVYYPYRSIFTGRQQHELEFGVKDEGDYFRFTANIPQGLVGESLFIPPIEKGDITEIDETDLSKTREFFPSVYLDGTLLTPLDTSALEVVLPDYRNGDLEVRVPKIKGYYSSSLSAASSGQKPLSCNQFNTGLYKHDIVSEGDNKLLRLNSVSSSNCLDFHIPNLSQRLSYLVTIENRNIVGKSLLFGTINNSSGRADTETYLPKSQIQNPNVKENKSYFIIPPMEYYGEGYTLHFDNISIGKDQTINDLGKITLNPIPYNFLTSLKVVRNNQILWGAQDEKNTELTVDHPNPSYYEVGIKNQELGSNSQTLVLSQSYDSGWKAYQVTNDWLTDSWYMRLFIPLFGREIKTHVMVNNWENGWNIQNATMQQCNTSTSLSAGNATMKCTISIVYLPQYLEYLGFGILGGFGIYLLLNFNKRFAANTKFSNKQATLTGPTPPGTGV